MRSVTSQWPLDPPSPVTDSDPMTNEHSERVSVTIEGGIADVRLNRADKMNALDGPMFDALVATSASLAADPTVRVVVLSGNGRAFCAGLDFGGFQAMASGGGASGDGASEASEDGAVGGQTAISHVDEDSITHHGQQAVYGWTDLPVPVIAAVHGVALGGGIQLALGADIRIVAPDARMSVLEIRWGLVPDMTGTKRLVELVGLDVAKELTFTGRMVEGAEAQAIGLATKVADDPYAAAMEMAAEIAQKSPDAVRAAKRMLRAVGTIDEATAFATERREIGALIGSPNQVEAIQAYFEKRDARYV
jgi:enoyl-CoA hydratase/carnithine racemase